ncbi:unnamed protein product, partial [Rodentolepis nana]|uniref:Uncharacterized protein n=1 Tax=Rodentolepis nana TaxID=102285 RepID=A0A0R3TEK7_RODNA
MGDQLNTTYSLDEDSRVFDDKELPETPVKMESAGINRRSLRPRPTPKIPNSILACTTQLCKSPVRSSNTRKRRNVCCTIKVFLSKAATTNAPKNSVTRNIPMITTPWTGMTPQMVKQRGGSRTAKKSDIQVPESTKTRASSALSKINEYVPRTPTKIEVMSPRQWALKTSLRNSAVRTHSYGSLPPKNMFVPIKPVPKLDFDDDDNVNPTSIMVCHSLFE